MRNLYISKMRLAPYDVSTHKRNSEDREDSDSMLGKYRIFPETRDYEGPDSTDIHDSFSLFISEKYFISLVYKL